MLGFTQKVKTAFPAFATDSIADLVKAGVDAAATAGGLALGGIPGVLAKDLVSALLKRASQIERKLDRLLSEPLVTALTLLAQATQINPRSPKEVEAIHDLLLQAHVAFVRAHSVCGDSREDSLFIRTLDCIAVSGDEGLAPLARSMFAEIDADLSAIRVRVRELEEASTSEQERAATYNGWLKRGDHNRDRPLAWAEMRWLGKRMESRAHSLEKIAVAAKQRLSILEALALVARDGIQQRSDG